MKKVLLGGVLALILVVGGCFALVATAFDAADEAVQAEEENDKPTAVAEGKAFTHDGYAVTRGWKVVPEEFGGATIEGLTVTNQGDQARIAQLTFTLVKGNENLAEVECSSNELQPGQKSRMDCVSLDSGDPQGYEEVQVSDMW